MLNPAVIAVVDDDEGVRLALTDLLQVLTLSCLTFDGPKAFLAAYVPGAFDCLVTDIRMPGMSGLELQQQVRSLGSTIPVIVVTSSTDPASRSCALKDGAVAFLRKPADDETLIRHLKVALGPDFIGR